MTRLTRAPTFALSLFALTAFALPAAATPAPPVVLKPKVTVSTAQVRLGDVFLNAGQHAEAKVTASPEPGQSVVLDARTLLRLARGYALDWQPEKPGDAVVVEREGVVLDRRLIEQRIVDALAERGLDPTGLAVSVAEPSPPVIVSPAAGLAVERLSYRPPARRFAAVLTVNVDDQVVRRINVAGDIARSASIPVLDQGLKRGEVIAASNVRWVEVDENRLPGSTVLLPGRVIGLAARRDMRPGVPILVNDLTRAVVVEKDSLVTMQLSTPGMHLTARGRALQDGGEGEVIRVVNLQSKMTVEGVVTGPGVVAVGPQPASK